MSINGLLTGLTSVKPHIRRLSRAAFPVLQDAVLVSELTHDHMKDLQPYFGLIVDVIFNRILTQLSYSISAETHDYDYTGKTKALTTYAKNYKAAGYVMRMADHAAQYGVAPSTNMLRNTTAG